MKIAITGHTKGIGAALSDLLGKEHTILGFSRSNGYDISKAESIDSIISSVLECDIFINNAYHDLSQVTLFEGVLALWHSNPNKTIVNINSKASYSPPNGRDYTKFKKVLRSSAVKAIADIDRKCRVININPGYVTTERTVHAQEKYKMLSPEQLAVLIKWCIDQPQEIEIGEIGIWRTTM